MPAYSKKSDAPPPSMTISCGGVLNVVCSRCKFKITTIIHFKWDLLPTAKKLALNFRIKWANACLGLGISSFATIPALPQVKWQKVHWDTDTNWSWVGHLNLIFLFTSTFISQLVTTNGPNVHLAISRALSYCKFRIHFNLTTDDMRRFLVN